MKNKLKELFGSKNESSEGFFENGNKLKKAGVRPDLYDEDYAVKNITNQRERSNSTPVTQQPTPRASMDDVHYASQSARNSMWRASESTAGGRRSVDTTRTSVDLVDAANEARKSRGETPLPVEPERVDIVNPEKARRTSIGSHSRYSPAGGDAARANAAAETVSRRASKRASRQSTSFENEYSSAPDHSVNEIPNPRLGRGESVDEVPPLRTTSRRTRSRSRSTDPRRIEELAESLNGLDLTHSKTTLLKEPELGTGFSDSLPDSFPSPPPKSRRRSVDIDLTGVTIPHKIVAPVLESSIMNPDGTLRERYLDTKDVVKQVIPHKPGPPQDYEDILKPDGTLHERYLTNTEEVVSHEKKFARAVIHERVITRVHNIITTQIMRDIHTHEIRQHILPVIDKQYLPERHWIQTADGRFVEINPNEVNHLEEQYKHATRVDESISAVKVDGRPFQQLARAL